MERPLLKIVVQRRRRRMPGSATYATNAAAAAAANTSQQQQQQQPQKRRRLNLVSGCTEQQRKEEVRLDNRNNNNDIHKTNAITTEEEDAEEDVLLLQQLVDDLPSDTWVAMQSLLLQRQLQQQSTLQQQCTTTTSTRSSTTCIEIPLVNDHHQPILQLRHHHHPLPTPTTPTNPRIRAVLECQLHEFYSGPASRPLESSRGQQPGTTTYTTHSAPSRTQPATTTTTIQGGHGVAVVRELDQLVQAKTVLRLCASIALPLSSCAKKTNRNTATTTADLVAYMTMDDYIRAARHAISVAAAVSNNTPGAVHGGGGGGDDEEWWFQQLLRLLQQTTPNGTRLSDSSNNNSNDNDEDSCLLRTIIPTDSETKEEADATTIQWLMQDCQVLLRKQHSPRHASANTHAQWQAWLPGWGRFVVPAFVKAARDALVYLNNHNNKRSGRGSGGQGCAERSVASMERFLRDKKRSPIPVQTVLLPWLVAQGRIVRIDRPSGSFVKLAGKP